MSDLFGKEIPDFEPDRSGESDYQAFKRQNRYRLADCKKKRCKFCKFKATKRFGKKNYYKCHLIGTSSCGATDIALRNVCDKWEAVVV